MPDPLCKRKQGSPALRRFRVEQPQARPTGFHETRDTNHESRPLCFSRNTRHESRITAFMLFFPRFPGISRYSSAPPAPWGRCPRSVRRSRWASRRASIAGNPGKVYKIPDPAERLVLANPEFPEWLGGACAGVSARPPFPAGVTASAVRWKSRKSVQNPGSRRLRAASAAAKAEETHAEKGERCILHRQETFSIALTFWVGQAGWTG